MTPPKSSDTGGRYLLITALFMVILQGGLLVGVALNDAKDKEQGRMINIMWRDYMPTVFMEGIMKSYDLQTQEIVATLKGDPMAVKEVNIKFTEFRKEMFNTLQRMRGGMSSDTRNIKPVKVSGTIKENESLWDGQ